MIEAVGFTSSLSDSWVFLPSAEDRVNIRRWAMGEAKSLIKMHGEVPAPGAKEQLISHLAGWARVAIDDMSTFHTPLALTNVPPSRVDALGYITAFQREDGLQSPGDIERLDFDIQGTPLATPRSFELTQSPLGPGVRTFSLRHSSFNGVATDVRNLDYFIFPAAYPDKCVVVGAYWPHPEHDDYIVGQLAQMVETLTMTVQVDD